MLVIAWYPALYMSPLKLLFPQPEGKGENKRLAIEEEPKATSKLLK